MDEHSRNKRRKIRAHGTPDIAHGGFVSRLPRLPSLESNVSIYDTVKLSKPEDVRILWLDAEDDFNAPLEGSLEVRKESTHYDALSYAWGQEPEERQSYSVIKLRTTGTGAPHNFLIAANLESALRHLRDEATRNLDDEAMMHPGDEENPGIGLWIDAICINQFNSEEKSHQVPLMWNIYNQAACVRVWLGEAEGDTVDAFNFVSQVLNLASFDRLVKDGRMVEEWEAFYKLMKRPWFGRRWVVQEIALARSAILHCGHHTEDWKRFKDAVALFEKVETRDRCITELFRKSAAHNNNPNFLGDVRFIGASRLVNATSNLFRRSENGRALDRLVSLDSLISMLTTFQSSDPRDTIYAVLALAADTRSLARPSINTPVESEGSQGSGVHSSLNPVAGRFIATLRDGALRREYTVDYDKSYLAVCQDFIQFSIGNTYSLDVICRPWAPDPDGVPEHVRRKIPDWRSTLPSWIPTLAGAAFGPRPDGHFIRINADPLVGLPGPGGKHYSAAKNTKVVYRFDRSAPLSLFVDGFVLDLIATTKTEAIGGNISPKWLDFGGWIDRTAEPPEELWRTLVADRGSNSLNPPTYYNRACQYAFGQGVARAALNAEQLITNGICSVGEEFLRRMQDVIWNRRLMRSSWNRFLGLVPESAEPSDIICILYGCSVPVVLRRVETSGGVVYHQLIGECYVHGMMDGEAFDLQTAERVAFESKNKGLGKEELDAMAKYQLKMLKRTFELQ